MSALRAAECTVRLSKQEGSAERQIVDDSLYAVYTILLLSTSYQQMSSTMCTSAEEGHHQSHGHERGDDEPKMYTPIFAYQSEDSDDERDESAESMPLDLVDLVEDNLIEHANITLVQQEEKIAKRRPMSKLGKERFARADQYVPSRKT